MPKNQSRRHRPGKYLRLVFSQAPGVVWATDRDLRLTHVHGRTAMLDDAASERLVGTTIYDFVGSRDPSEPAIAHHLAALAGGHQSFQYQRRGLWFEVLIEPLVDADGGIVGCVGAAMDVTAQQETARKLQRAVSLLEATLDATADGILVVDREGRVATYNRRFLELWRVPPSLLEQRDDSALLALVVDQLEDPEAFLGAVRNLYASPDQDAFDVLRFRDGRVFDRYSMPQSVGGSLVGRVWSFRDVTERERLLRRATFLGDATRLLSSLDVTKALSSVAQLAVPYLRRALRGGSDPVAPARAAAGRRGLRRLPTGPGAACRRPGWAPDDLHRGLAIAPGDPPEVQGRGRRRDHVRCALDTPVHDG